MFGIALIAVLSFGIVFLYPVLQKKPVEVEHNARYDVQMKRLWNAAQTSMRDHKPLRAEKALLTILKFDEKNAAAYNRLGILYAKEQKFDEAIECFEIAQSLDNNPSSLHNVGLIYLETGAYEKASMAFEQAIELENTVPARYIALSKAKERLGQNKAAIDALEHAYTLDHSTNTLRQILAIYEAMGDTEGLTSTTARIEAQIAKNNKQNERPRRTTATKNARRNVAPRASAARRISSSSAKTTPPRPVKRVARVTNARKKI